MLPNYDLDKIRFATDPKTFAKAVDLYEKGKIKKFKEELNGFFAVVLGTQSYEVYVDKRYYDRGNCNCYLGQNDVLCKHMVAVALQGILQGKPIPAESKQTGNGATSSGRVGELDKDALAEVKHKVTDALRYIRAYDGPSRTWFAYQGSLAEGAARLSAVVTKLPVSKQTAIILVDLLLRLDKKVCSGGVDDSDGTVGSFMQEVVLVLLDYVKLEPKVREAFEKLVGKETCFGWEEPLLK